MRVLDVSEANESESKGIEFCLPLHWAADAVARMADEFWHFLLGSGILLGGEPRRAILDVVDVFTHGKKRRVFRS